MPRCSQTPNWSVLPPRTKTATPTPAPHPAKAPGLVAESDSPSRDGFEVLGPTGEVRPAPSPLYLPIRPPGRTSEPCQALEPANDHGGVCAALRVAGSTLERLH